MTSHVLRLSMLTILATLIGTSFELNWDGLTVKYGEFNALPLTEDAAISQGWVKLGPSCQDPKSESCCKASGKWPGVRYVKDEDYAIILLFDVRGNSAGIQTSFPKSKAVDFPADFQPFVEDGPDDDRWTVTAYFTSPKYICKEEKKAPRKGLFLQRTSEPLESVKVKARRSLRKSPLWTEGRCVPTMGHHFWSFNSENLDKSCFAEESFPAFVLYDKKNAPVGFGWSFVMDLQSPKYERFPIQGLQNALKDVPKCAKDKPQIFRTMHIYFTTKAEVVKIGCPE